ncbi:MAG TPA: PA14 domain-containing protein, partial [Candidatus Limnocylindria bacterium]|nr:PA14 domain-containing protein [Candidatus Limnocylindria bacterium]
MKQHANAEAVIRPLQTSTSLTRRGLGAPPVRWWYALLALTLGCFVALGQSIPASPAFLRLADLARTVEQFGRTNCSLQLEGIICAVGDRPGSFVFQDSSTVEMVRLDPAPQGLRPGMRVRISGKECPVLRDGYGLVLSTLLINNDGIHQTVEKSAAVSLRAGLYPIRVAWFNLLGDRGLKLEYQGPNLPRQGIATNLLFHAIESTNAGNSRMADGLAYQAYEGTWYRMPRFDRLDPVKTGLVDQFDDRVSTRLEKVAVDFNGYLRVPTDGAYTFHLSSDDGSQLFFGHPPFKLEITGTNQVPQPRPFLGGEILGPNEPPAQWAEAEGTVTYIARKATGMDLEVTSGASHWRAEITDGSGLTPRLILHSRLHFTGIRRNTHAFDGQP